MKITKALLMALIMLLVSGVQAPAQAQAENPGYQTPAQVENVAPGPSWGVFCPVFRHEIAQNAENVEIPAIEDCCLDLDICIEDVENLKKERPNVPLYSLLMQMVWFKNLPPWARVTIVGIVDAGIAGGLVYIGTLQAK